MSEKAAIESTKRPNTVRSLTRELGELGVQPGDTLLVHTSLSAIGWVCGGPQAVIEALQQAVGEGGTIAMPAHSGDWSDPAQWCNPPVPPDWFEDIYENMPAFDPLRTPTRGIGQVPELFRTWPGTLRSTHPQVSFCAWGRHAVAVTAAQPLTPAMGMESPLGALYRLGAKVLMLGTGYGTCTCFHLAEAMCPQMPKTPMGTAVMENGRRVWKWFEDYACYDFDDFEQIGADFDGDGAIRTGAVGNADCRLFPLPLAVDFARDWMQKHRFEAGKATS